MKAEDCPQLNTCPKVGMVLAKDLAGDWQYAEAIRAVCSHCTRGQGEQGQQETQLRQGRVVVAAVDKTLAQEESVELADNLEVVAAVELGALLLVVQVE